MERFASWFHQDWILVFPDFDAGARLHISQLGDERRSVLKRQFSKFLSRNEGASTRSLKNQWLRLGAQGWQRGCGIGAFKRWKELM
ncbi:hypothetical protein KXR53_15035 [Inquilinus limosus]|uniref:hypothetical protein n=1 Tax=Inquilinus limosus TaxID=171674 RepID=UPI003F17AF38